MRTIVVSDLHLGSARNTDLLRRPDLRAPLLEAVRGADRLVILGDGVELRDRPKRDIAELAAPVFRDLGEALGPDGELVMTAGNHDHGLVAGWIDGRLETEPSGFLGLEQHLEPAEAGPLARALAGHAASHHCATVARWATLRCRPSLLRRQSTSSLLRAHSCSFR